MREAALLAGMIALACAAPARADDRLARAIGEGDGAETRLALDGVDRVNGRLAFGETPLARAVETQDPQLVTLLLARGAKPNAADAEGLTPLTLACERGGATIVGQLLDAGAKVRKAAADGTTPLAICARFSTGATVARMLAMGAKPDQVDARGQTALMWAASAGNVEAVGLLLAAGAQPNRTTREGFTPLFFAITGGAPEATKALLAAGADASHRGPENTSALQLALYQKNWPVAAMLAERGADLAERDRNGEQPLHVAAAAGDLALVSLLLRKGAAVNGLTGPSRITWVTEANFGMAPAPVPPTPPLLIAAQHGHAAIMAQLLASGAEPGFVAANGVNVLLAAASGTSAAALEAALRLAPDANVTNDKGATPLHKVLGSGMHADLEAMLRVLAAHGARPDIANLKGETPAQLADEGLATVKAVYVQVFGAIGTSVLATANVASRKPQPGSMKP